MFSDTIICWVAAFLLESKFAVQCIKFSALDLIGLFESIHIVSLSMGLKVFECSMCQHLYESQMF